jgi:hypothetical protein
MSAMRIVLATVGVALCNLIDNPANSQHNDTGTNMRPWTVTHGKTSSSATGKQFKSSKNRAKSGEDSRGLWQINRERGGKSGRRGDIAGSAEMASLKMQQDMSSRHRVETVRSHAPKKQGGTKKGIAGKLQ